MVYLGNLERKDNLISLLGRIAPFQGQTSLKGLKISSESSTLHPEVYALMYRQNSWENMLFWVLCLHLKFCAQSSLGLHHQCCEVLSEISRRDTANTETASETNAYLAKKAIQKCHDAEHILFPMACRLLACWSLTVIFCPKAVQQLNLLQAYNISKEVTESTGISLLLGWRA